MNRAKYQRLRLAQLERDGVIKLGSPGEGRRASVYRKVRAETAG